MKKHSDLAHGLVQRTGGTLNEVTSLKVEDVKIDAYGHVTVSIGIGSSAREAIVDDSELVMELLEDARAAGREMLLESVTPNFDCTRDRAIYARRLYALVSAGGRVVSKKPHHYGDNEYDRDAMTIVFRSMGITDTNTMATLFKMEI